MLGSVPSHKASNTFHVVKLVIRFAHTAI